jgi:GWxTD domain-containing protein
MQYCKVRSFLAAVLIVGLACGVGLLAQTAPTTSGNDSAAPTKASDKKATDSSKSSTQQEDPLKRPLTEKQKKENQKKLQKEVGANYKKWLNEDVRWIISGEEEQAFKQLSNDEERDQFIEQFWLRRDPTPDTVENEYKEEHYRRIAYANEHFAAGKQGWRTDRGRIYIAYGPPDEIESHASGGLYNRTYEEGGGSTSTYPFEKWRYRYIEGIGNEVILEFVDACMCNEYRLTIDPNEKDALATTPGAGLTQAEEMGQASKADRMLNPNNSGFGNMGGGSRQFNNLELLAKINRPPPVKFKDLENEAISHKIRYNMLPFDWRADFVRTGGTVLVPITIQVKNKDLTLVEKDGIMTGSINIFGRVTNLTGRIMQTFEDTVKVDVPKSLLAQTVEASSIYWKAVPLLPGKYKLDLVLKDVGGDRVGTMTRGIQVPGYDDEKLATSSLILADLMEKVPARSIGTGNFVIGGTKVRPRVEAADGRPATFKKGQRMNIWMQVYNLGMDEKTKKPSATIEYDIVNTATNKSVAHVTENTEQMGNVGEQLTLEKSVPLNLEAGQYRVTIKVDDKVTNQTIAPTTRFAVE